MGRPILDRTPKATIHKHGRRWIAHRTRGVGNVSPSLSAWTRRGIERKVRRWIDRETAEQRQIRETEFTMSGDSDVEQAWRDVWAEVNSHGWAIDTLRAQVRDLTERLDAIDTPPAAPGATGEEAFEYAPGVVDGLARLADEYGARGVLLALLDLHPGCAFGEDGDDG